MENKQQKLKEVNSRGYQQLDKKSLIVGSIIATFLAITPFLYYLYESVPDEKFGALFVYL